MRMSRWARHLAMALTAGGLVACSSTTPEFTTKGLVPPSASCRIDPRDIGLGEQMSPIDRGNGCMVPNPWRMSEIAGVTLRNGAVMNCGAVDVVGEWMQDVVQPAAQSSFGEPVVAVRVASSFSCRARNSVRGSKMSEHGFGNAIDIAEFTLASGRSVTVLKGWGGSSDERQFLREVRQESCDHFNTVLGPGSDRYHSDHLHLDLAHRKSGRGKYCR